MVLTTEKNDKLSIYEFQYEFLMSEKPLQLLAGGSGIGKTWIAALKVVEYGINNPRCEMMIASSTWDNTVKIMVRAIMEWVAQMQGTVAVWKRGYNTIEFKNGSIIYIKNLQKPGALKGFNLDLMWIDEATEIYKCQDILEQAQNRMRSDRDYRKMILLTTNPDLKTHYLYKKFYEEFNPQTMYRASLPAYAGAGHLPESFYERLRSMSEHRKEMLLDGKWGSLEGQIYALKEGYHIKPFLADRNWTYYITYDYGYNPDPMVYLLVGVWKKRIYIINEMSFKNILIGTYQEPKLKRFVKNYPIAGFTGDKSSKATIRWLRSDIGWKYFPCSYKRYTGWMRLLDYFETHYDDTDTSRITIHPRCRGLVKSLSSMVWDTKKLDAAPGDDHHADALRYFCMSPILMLSGVARTLGVTNMKMEDISDAHETVYSEEALAL